MAQQYIGVYATREKNPVLQGYTRPPGTRKRLWFVWEIPGGNYLVQGLNAARQPMTAPRTVTGKELLDRFMYEPECFFAPEGYEHPAQPKVRDADAPLPDLFKKNGTAPAASPPSPRPKSAFPAASDPNLLQFLAKNNRARQHSLPDSVRIPFDRLVGEVVVTSEGGGDANALAAGGGLKPSPGFSAKGGKTPDAVPEQAGASGGAAEETAAEEQQVRTLRSQFVQGLLLLRRGERTEGYALLEKLLREPYTSFPGGAQLFSEFGLGLRRLGFIALALAAHKRALEFAPRDERILFNISRGYHDMGLLPEAIESLRQALAVAPDFAAARQFLDFLSGGDGDDVKK